MISPQQQTPCEQEIADQLKRYRQALHIGYVEMERIVEEIIISEFTRIGEVLLEHGYETEVVVFDSESEHDERMYVCGAGLKMTKGYMKNAIVYTGDPHNFQFILQTQNFAARTTEEVVDYHRLTPNWFYKRVKHFMQTSCRNVDFSHIEQHFPNDWEIFEPPFAVKMKNEYGYYNQIASATTIEEALQKGSSAVKGNFSEEDLLVMDKNGREIN